MTSLTPINRPYPVLILFRNIDKFSVEISLYRGRTRVAKSVYKAEKGLYQRCLIQAFADCVVDEQLVQYFDNLSYRVWHG